ncbi:nucleoside triphosphate pyrophosphohydrolase [Paenibacillus sp. FSL K6-3166]|uniref:nucleoside triphosphate pyrophosphohydrolase n=1 Tax=unclassified Paenibacillus TaxID=185978 RepID=UPI000BA0B5B8|nr:nucleoside triphosphate pyrophosphohydrolase [Paenibacillus sp. VTT E-133291]OZQ97857.1 phosphoribosyl-ATP pyrophosphohydrolase [Paenibacillus sp. VTT E-133291]
MPVYEKLVRDGIPNLIASQGKDFKTRILDSKEYITELRKKLKEESEEYFRAVSNEEALEELADMLEVIQALAELRAEKAERRGGFKEQIFLIDVERE